METIDFDFIFTPTFDGREIPEWAWAIRDGVWKGRATIAAVLEIVGPITFGGDAGEKIESAMPTLRNAACAKVQAARGALAEPVIVDAGDF